MQYTMTSRASPIGALLPFLMLALAATLGCPIDVDVGMQGEDGGGNALPADGGAPEIELEAPALCDFGVVEVGTSSACVVTIQNIGETEAQLTAFLIEQGAPVFVPDPTAIPAVPLDIEASGAFSLTILATPEAAGSWTADLVVSVAGGDEIRIALRADSIEKERPEALARVLSINGAELDVGAALPELRRYDRLRLTAEDSTAAQGRTVVSTLWELIASPAGSEVEIDEPTAIDTDLGVSGVLGLDRVGVYLVRVTVTDDEGTTSTNDAILTLPIPATRAVHVQMTWDSPDNDFDVHMKVADADWCSLASCYRATCRVGADPRPDFDDVPGFSAGDPELDIDDLSGFGPENINIHQPIDGVYRIGVHAYGALSPPVTATVKVFIDGVLAWEDEQAFAAGGEFWDVSELSLNDEGVAITAVDVIQSGWQCL